MNNTVSKNIYKLVLVLSIVFLIYGILRVNNTLPQIVKGYSSFVVTEAENPKSVTIGVANYKVTFSEKNFESFFKGIDLINNSLKHAIGK